jgi:mRNA interferase MazF
MNAHPGEIWLVDLGLAAKTRPVIVVSRFDPDRPRALTVYVPITTQGRGSGYEVDLPRLPYLQMGSVANIQGIGSAPDARFERRLGELPIETLVELRHALASAFEILG